MALAIGYNIEFLDKFSAVANRVNKKFDRIRRHAKQATTSVDRFKRKLSAIAIAAKRTTLANNRLGDSFDAVRNKALQFLAIGFALALPIRKAIQFESAMSDVRKVVDFDTPQQFKQFGDDIVEMTKKIPLAATELAAIATAGGQFGLKVKQLPNFINQVAKASVAWDISTEDAGQRIAKLANVLNTPIAKINETSDAINHLSNNMAHNASQLLEVTVRGGSAGKMFGLTNDQIAAMGSSLLALGLRQERAGTTMTIMFRKFNEIAQEDKIFKRDYMKSPQDAINNYLQKIADIKDPLKRAAFITDKFGDEGARGINKIVGSMDKYKGALALVANKTDFLGSVQAEYDIRLETTANNLQLLVNHVEALAVAIGNALLPAVNVIAKVLIVLIQPLLWMAKNFPILTKAVALFGAALAFEKIVVIAWTLAVKLSTMAVAQNSVVLRANLILTRLMSVAISWNTIKLVANKVVTIALTKARWLFSLATIANTKALGINSMSMLMNAKRIGFLKVVTMGITRAFGFMRAAIMVLGKTGPLIAISALVASIMFMLKKINDFLDTIKGMSFGEVVKNMGVGIKASLGFEDKELTAIKEKIRLLDEQRANNPNFNKILSEKTPENLAKAEVNGSVQSKVVVEATQGTKVKSVETQTTGMVRDLGPGMVQAGQGA
jgi:TP901 family phage tail tape measure protein